MCPRTPVCRARLSVPFAWGRWARTPPPCGSTRRRTRAISARWGVQQEMYIYSTTRSTSTSEHWDNRPGQRRRTRPLSSRRRPSAAHRPLLRSSSPGANRYLCGRQTFRRAALHSHVRARTCTKLYVLCTRRVLFWCCCSCICDTYTHTHALTGCRRTDPLLHAYACLSVGARLSACLPVLNAQIVDRRHTCTHTLNILFCLYSPYVRLCLCEFAPTLYDATSLANQHYPGARARCGNQYLTPRRPIRVATSVTPFLEPTRTPIPCVIGLLNYLDSCPLSFFLLSMMTTSMYSFVNRRALVRAS